MVGFPLQTGNSKGYAFVEFASEDVAKIVADTMNNYLFGERLLQCKCSSLTMGLSGRLLLVHGCAVNDRLLTCLAVPLHLWDDSPKYLSAKIRVHFLDRF